jgi:ParB family chromosome partitioning protein
VSKERRLGRGLEALLGMTGEPVPGGHAIAPTPPTAGIAGGQQPAPAPAPVDGILRIAVDDLEANPFQPRRDFDPAEIESLAASLRAHGLIQPIAVRRIAGGRYQLIAGERRLRAAKQVGWTEVPAKVIEADDRTAAELAIVENLQRKDLNPLEKALSFRQYIERYGSTQEELASRLQINRSTVANFIRLLELPDEIQRAVCEEKISYGHARALLPLGDEREQLDYCRRIQTEGLSVRAVEDLVQDAIHTVDRPTVEMQPERAAKTKPTKSKHNATLEQQLRLALGTKVDIRQSGKGRGKIVVHFANAEEFERLFQNLAGPNSLAAAG